MEEKKKWTVVRQVYKVAWVVTLVNIARLWSPLDLLFSEMFPLNFKGKQFLTRDHPSFQTNFA